MTDRHIDLILGSLLHDIGKVIYRTGSRENHSESGYRYLREETGIGRAQRGKEILDCVRYHHAKPLRAASVPEDSLAYITYIADNIASAADRRASDEPEPGFETRVPLESIFNHLNGDGPKHYYSPGMLDENYPEGINYPSVEKKVFTESQYSAVKKKITQALDGMKWDEEYLDSLLEILEATLTYIPSSTSKQETADISLYDHMKITAALAGCIYLYLESRGEKDYRKALLLGAEDFYKEEAFLLYSVDLSGIQNFIYTVNEQDALRMLRARSFYLEVFMENLIDEILCEAGVSRANLIYCGGGHMYALLPNTEEVKATLDRMEKKVNGWLLDHFQTSLYAASGYAACSADSLKNMPQGSYKAIYRELGKQISAKKMSRYTAEEIIRLNEAEFDGGARECRICRSAAHVDEEGLCEICAAMKNLSADVLYQDFFTVLSAPEEGAVPLMENRWLVAENEEQLRARIRKNKEEEDGEAGASATFIRAFAKNAFYSGKRIATKLWTGNYTIKSKTMSEYAKDAEGIDRIAVLRMDVDNLGQAFVSGFENGENENRYVTLSRTATFSRQMTIFFKYHINQILKRPVNRELAGAGGGEPSGGRDVSVVYSGGDDVFLLGGWDDVIGAAVDIRNSFAVYSQNKLTISAGIGLYGPSYPIHIMADETGDLESFAKEREGKNAVTVFEAGGGKRNAEKCGKSGKRGSGKGMSDAAGKTYQAYADGGRYGWDVFEQKVLSEKYRLLNTFFENSQERGKSFLYRLLTLLRSREEKINYARYLYLLARLEPAGGDGEAERAERENYKRFSGQMCEWFRSEEDSRQLITAMYLYAYHMRMEEESDRRKEK